MAYILQFQLDANGARALQQAMNYAVDYGPKDAQQTLKEAGIAYCQAGRNLTPKAKKGTRRQVASHTTSFKNGKSLLRWGVMVLTQTRPAKFVSVRGATTAAQAQASRLAVVPRIGSGRNSWKGAMRDLVKSSSVSGSISSSRAMGTTFNPMREISNSLSYLLKIAPAIDEAASRRAAKTIAIKTEKYLNKAGFK
jgi:hypothetical protein